MIYLGFTAVVLVLFGLMAFVGWLIEVRQPKYRPSPREIFYGAWPGVSSTYQHVIGLSSTWEIVDGKVQRLE